ncbi:Hypothetical protein ORPV_242 [Orpheovirus IHUMI-LCC2]|uniref:Uncharacterized protein n=1 Tax=Orpheovirus IHUMI-LCC2 TaxID=2023057 RepID=A0A2I2L3N7_9VIRU|nr:Hypothetical protein ORPV_242 [Orpheovirus IHUMI-LCC2]SNW62146.1 Hypothetical protein ORPV_242 [Orpheovirus IHUMI-LCC2]
MLKTANYIALSINKNTNKDRDVYLKESAKFVFGIMNEIVCKAYLDEGGEDIEDPIKLNFRILIKDATNLDDDGVEELLPYVISLNLQNRITGENLWKYDISLDAMHNETFSNIKLSREQKDKVLNLNKQFVYKLRHPILSMFF